MAYDERLKRNYGLWTGWIDAAISRWETLGKEWRKPIDTSTAATTEAGVKALLFSSVGAVQGQFIHNWNSLNELWYQEGDPLPSVVVSHTKNKLNGKTGFATVGVQLAGVPLDGTKLEMLGGATNIGASGTGYKVEPTGAYDGRVKVTMISKVPKAGTYRGLLRYTEGAAKPKPLAWLIVIAV